MKSKAHSKKCVELGIVPVPTSADDPQGEDSSKVICATQVQMIFIMYLKLIRALDG